MKYIIISAVEIGLLRYTRPLITNKFITTREIARHICDSRLLGMVRTYLHF